MSKEISMKLKKEFSDFYTAIRIDSESHVLKEKREVLEDDIRSNLPSIFQIMVSLLTKVIFG